jgi:hypothetical protein
LLDGRSSKPENLGSLGLARYVIVEEEIPHDEVIEVILVCVMAFVKYHKVYLFHL